MGDASIKAGDRNVLRLGKLIAEVGEVATLRVDLATVFGRLQEKIPMRKPRERN